MQYVVALILILAALVLLRGLWHLLDGVFSGLGDAFSSPGHVLALVAISLVIVAVIMFAFYEATVYVNRQRFRAPEPWSSPARPPIMRDGETLLPPEAVPDGVPAPAGDPEAAWPAPSEPVAPSVSAEEAEAELLRESSPEVVAGAAGDHADDAGGAWPQVPVEAEASVLAEQVAAGEAVVEPPPLFAPRITEVPSPATPLPKRTPLNGRTNGAANGPAVTGNQVRDNPANGTPANGTAVNGTAVNGTAVNGTAVNGSAVNGSAVNGTAPAPSAAGEGEGSEWLANARLLIAPDPVLDEPFPRDLEEGERRRLSLYPFTVRVPKIDLEARLGSPEVRQAARRLADDAGSDNLRLALVTALTSDSDNLFLNEPAVVLRVTTIRAQGGPVRDRLDRLVLVATGTGLGDRTGEEGHRVRAVDPTPEARLLLTGNARLASALVNAAFPVAGADSAVLDQRLLGTIDALDLDGSIRRKPTGPADGTPLEINGLSGASTSAQAPASSNQSIAS